MSLRRIVTVGTTVLLSWQSTASAETYVCRATKFCAADERKEFSTDCRSSDRAWTIETKGWHAVLHDGAKTIRFKEARPYFIRMGWYQTGDGRNGTLTNLFLSTNSGQATFSIRLMAPNDVNKYVWVYEGNCQRTQD